MAKKVKNLTQHQWDTFKIKQRNSNHKSDRNTKTELTHNVLSTSL